LKINGDNLMLAVLTATNYLYAMPLEADIILLEKLKHNDNFSFKQLYSKYFTSIAQYITNNNGSIADAEDIFQEAMLVLLNKIKDPNFILTASLQTYFFAIVKNLWLKKLRSFKVAQRYNAHAISQTEQAYIEPSNTVLLQEENITNWFTKITANCQRVLKAIFFFNIPMEKLMQQMGWKNKHTASNQKYKCIEQIRKESKK
jgi:RNA polymerase sigma factor (sigma-70 family)